jgi:hypothetical protein
LFLIFNKNQTKIAPNVQLLKEFEDSFKEKAPTMFVRGGFIGASDTSINQEKGQLYEMNPIANSFQNTNHNINNAFYGNMSNSTKFSASLQNLNFLTPQYNSQNINANLPIYSGSTQDKYYMTATAEKNKQENDKKNLKGRSLIQEIIQDTEISMGQSGKDYDRNSNLYLCNF